MSQRLIWILWPGFLMAAVGELVLFSMIDPSDLHLLGMPLDASRTAIYSLGFFVLWSFTSGASALTCLLQRSPYEVNYCHLGTEERIAIGCPKECGSAAPSTALHSIN
jgi:hypothetical protein